MPAPTLATPPSRMAPVVRIAPVTSFGVTSGGNADMPAAVTS